METHFFLLWHVATIMILLGNRVLHVTSVQSYPVRLTGGSNVYEGQVEVLQCNDTSSCEWTTVCTSGWNVNEASVVCKQLGLYYSTSGVDAPMTSYSVDDTDSNAAMINCNNSEYSALGYCSVSFTTSCESNNRTNVQCSSPPRSPSFSLPSFTNTTFVSATIRWTIGTDSSSRPASKYHVRCSNDGYHLHTRLVSNIILHNLEPCSLNTCCVGGIDANGAAGSVNCTSFRIPLLDASSTVPTGLEYTGLQSQSITLRWEQLPTRERCDPPIVYSVKVEEYNVPQQIVYSDTINTTNTYTIITGLSPYSLYNISVKACTNNIGTANTCGLYSTMIRVRTLQDVPSNIYNLMCHAFSPTQVSISWQPPTQPNGVIHFYEIILNNINTTQNTTKYVDNSTTAITMSYLHPNHHYLCSVAAHSAVGRNTSAVMNIKLNQSIPTGVPKQFTCSQNNLTSLQLDWSQPDPLEQNGPIEHYTVIVQNLDTSEVAYSNFTSYSPLIVSLLGSYHNYKCTVAANGQSGPGPFNERQVWISETDHIFGPPFNLQADHVTSTTFNVTWSEPNIRIEDPIHIKHYLIQVFDCQANTTIYNNISTVRYFEGRSLHPNYHYRINVSAVTVASVSGPVTYYTVQTKEAAPSGAPQNLSYHDVTSSLFILRWDEPPFEQQNGDIIGYMVRVVLHDMPTQLDTVNVTALTFTATSLKQGTRYDASVAAMTRVGIGPRSEVSIKLEAPVKVEVIVSPIVSAIVVFLLILVGLVLCRLITKMKKTHKSEVVQYQVNNGVVIENTFPQRFELSTSSEKKVKPPAVPPKTYLEPKTETKSTTPCPLLDEDAQSVNNDIDSCSVGSDSLYDIKLEALNPQLPQRSIYTVHEPIQIIEDGNIPTQNPPVQDAGIDHPKSTYVEAVYLSEATADLEEKMDGKEHSKGTQDYQKIDTKMLNPPSEYEHIHLRSKQKEKVKSPEDSASENHQHAMDQVPTVHGSQYELLQLKTMNKPSEYQTLHAYYTK